MKGLHEFSVKASRLIFSPLKDYQIGKRKTVNNTRSPMKRPRLQEPRESTEFSRESPSSSPLPPPGASGRASSCELWRTSSSLHRRGEITFHCGRDESRRPGRTLHGQMDRTRISKTVRQPAIRAIRIAGRGVLQRLDPRKRKKERTKNDTDSKP